jgi:hypothetical protein
VEKHTKIEDSKRRGKRMGNVKLNPQGDSCLALIVWAKRRVNAVKDKASKSDDQANASSKTDRIRT